MLWATHREMAHGEAVPISNLGDLFGHQKVFLLAIFVIFTHHVLALQGIVRKPTGYGLRKS